MANSASISSLGIEVLAVERLFYGAKLNGAISVFLLFSSQFLGYGDCWTHAKDTCLPEKHALALQLACELYVGNAAPATSRNEEASKSFLDCLRMYLLLGDFSRVDLPNINRYG